jgi:hypothetical protein
MNLNAPNSELVHLLVTLGYLLNLPLKLESRI